MGISGEAGEFIARFLLTLLRETINTVFGRDIKDDHDIAASIKDWDRLIDQLNHFKYIHNFTQDFLNNVGDRLFGDPNNPETIITSDTPPKKVKSRWEHHYEYDYEDKINNFKERLKRYKRQAEKRKNEEPPELLDRVTGHVQGCVTDLSISVPNTCKAADEFVETMEKIAKLALNILNIKTKDVDSVIKEIINNRRNLDLMAKRLLNLTDGVLVQLIDVLDSLYTRIISK